MSKNCTYTVFYPFGLDFVSSNMLYQQDCAPSTCTNVVRLLFMHTNSKCVCVICWPFANNSNSNNNRDCIHLAIATCNLSVVNSNARLFVAPNTDSQGNWNAVVGCIQTKLSGVTKGLCADRGFTYSGTAQQMSNCAVF